MPVFSNILFGSEESKNSAQAFVRFRTSISKLFRIGPCSNPNPTVA